MGGGAQPQNMGAKQELGNPSGVHPGPFPAADGGLAPCPRDFGVRWSPGVLPPQRGAGLGGVRPNSPGCVGARREAGDAPACEPARPDTHVCLGRARACVSPVSPVPPVPPVPLRQQNQRRESQSSGFLPGRKFQGFFCKIFHLKGSQGSECSRFQGRGVGPSLGRGGGNNTRKKDLFYFFPSKPEQRGRGEGSPACPTSGRLPAAPARTGADPRPVGKREAVGGFGTGCATRRRGGRRAGWPWWPLARLPLPPLPAPTIAAFRHSPARFPVFPRPVSARGAPPTRGDPRPGGTEGCRDRRCHPRGVSPLTDAREERGRVALQPPAMLEVTIRRTEEGWGRAQHPPSRRVASNTSKFVLP